MTRSAAARADRERAPRGTRAHATAVPRRVSGPAHPAAAHALAPSPAPRPRTAPRPPLRLAAGGAAVALRVGEAAMQVSGSRAMDRLVRSRAWIVIVAFGLIGIVAMQVSLLKLNAGIGRAVETAATLERNNATLRADVSTLSSGDRIQALAGARGFVMPEPADVTYLSAGTLGTEGARAARRMRAPDAQLAGPAGSAVAQPDAPAISGPGDAGATGTPDPPADAATTDPPAAATTPPAQTAAPAQATAPTGGATTAAPTTPAAPGATAANTGGPAGTAPTANSAGGVTLP